MDAGRPRNNGYTVTFINKNNREEEEITKEFNTVGNVIKFTKNFQRVFIRYREREEAQRAIAKFGSVYDVKMAKNNNDHPSEGGKQRFKAHNKQDSSSGSQLQTSSSESMEMADQHNNTSTVYHLILSYLPKNYTVKDVNGLVEEARPLCINEMGETKIFKIKAFYIALNSHESLTYLIKKLDGFVICGEKLVAIEAKSLLEWRNRSH